MVNLLICEKITDGIQYRELHRSELQKFRDIDRREEVFHIYYHRNGSLVLEEEYYDVPHWTEAQQDEFIHHLRNLYDAGGTVFGAFEQETCVGMASLASRFLGPNQELLNLNGFWVSQASRQQGVATTLLQMTIDKAKELGGKGLYVSATPSKNTVEYYMNRGFQLADVVDPQLFELEPEDIHLILRFEQ